MAPPGLLATFRQYRRKILEIVRTECPDHYQWLANKSPTHTVGPMSSGVRELLRDTSHLMATIVGDEEAWTQQLRGIRDGIGHIAPSQDAKTFHQVVAMIRSAQLLAEIVLPRQLGFADDEMQALD
jgi:hypothetical protein